MFYTLEVNVDASQAVLVDDTADGLDELVAGSLAHEAHLALLATDGKLDELALGHLVLDSSDELLLRLNVRAFGLPEDYSQQGGLVIKS